MQPRAGGAVPRRASGAPQPSERLIGQGPTTHPASLACGGQPLSCPLYNPFTFKLCYRCEDVKYKTASRRRSVYVLSERLKASTLGLDDVDDLKQVLQGSREAIILCDDNDITRAKLFQKVIELRAAAGECR